MAFRCRCAKDTDLYLFLVPQVGFGTAALGAACHSSVRQALKAGFRSFDSASDTGPWYRSEKCISDTIEEYISEEKEKHGKILEKTDFKITSKLHPNDFNEVRTEASIKHSLENLKAGYIDLYLLHYPGCGPKGETWLCPNRDGSEGTWKDVWPLLERYHRQGILHAIGVANFEVRELRELMDSAEIKPHVVQSWFDPYHQNWALFNFCKEHHITFQAYSALGTQWAQRDQVHHRNPILEDAVLAELAKSKHKSIPQIVLRWLLQEGISVIPRSTIPAHIHENFDGLFDFELTSSEILQIRQLNGKM